MPDDVSRRLRPVHGPRLLRARPPSSMLSAEDGRAGGDWFGRWGRAFRIQQQPTPRKAKKR
jgi:hypothetical protein